MRLIFRLVQCFVFKVICCQCVLADTTQESSFLTEWNQFFVLSTTALYEPRFSKISTFKTTIYNVVIHPLYKRKRLFEVYKPLINVFNISIPEAIDEFEKILCGTLRFCVT